jgi:hypothetical protein
VAGFEFHGGRFSNHLCPDLALSWEPWAGAAISWCAQDDREHALVLKMGPAGEWPSHERANFGGTFAVEKSVIENWLEIEAGVTMLGTTGHTELSGDIIFKKPFRISPTFEFMICTSRDDWQSQPNSKPAREIVTCSRRSLNLRIGIRRSKTPA